jgi:hypothetical protein
MVVLRLRNFSIMLCVLMLVSCYAAKKIQLAKTANNSNNLKLDGYYYCQNDGGSSVFILYRDGVYFDPGFIMNVSSLSKLDTEITTSYGSSFWNWGLYQLNGNNLIIERWLPGSGGPYPTQINKGFIADNKTILISGLRGSKHENEIDTFRFRYLFPKPDSTNTFIE